MGIFNMLKEIVDDLSGKTRLEELKQEITVVQEEFSQTVTNYNTSLSLYIEVKEKLNRKLNSCYDLINIYGLIDKRNKKINMLAIEEEIIKNNYDLSRLPDSVTTPYIMAGGVAGVLVPYGMYCAASTFGVASTGTAIATLSGAAATNATLATLGGGALTIGGGGMAAGATLLATAGVGCFVAPIVFKSYKNHKNIKKLKIEIKKIRAEEKELKNKMKQSKKLYLHHREILQTVEEYKVLYNNKMQEIVKEANEITRKFTEDVNGCRKIVEDKEVLVCKN